MLQNIEFLADLRPDGSPARERLELFLNESVQFRHMGLRVSLEAEGAVLEIAEIQDIHRGGTTGRSVNGAVQAFLFDAAIGCAALSRFPDLGRGSGVGRISMRMSKPPEAAPLRALARVVNERRNLVDVSVQLEDGGGVVCARGGGVVLIRRR